MRKLVRVLVLGTAAAGLLVGALYAADQAILGKSFSTKAKPPDGSKTKVKGTASEKNSPNPLVGDPTASSGGGALLTIFENGTSIQQSFALNQGTSSTGKPFWSGDATRGFKYKDAKGDQGPVKSAQIKKSGSGKFAIKVSLTGKNGPISIVPPNSGTDACIALQLGSGDRYSVQFGPAPNGKITNKGDMLFKVTKPTTEGVCPGGGTTTTTAPPTTTTTSMAPTTTTTAPTTTTTSTTASTTTTTAPTTTTTSTTASTTTTTAPTTTTTSTTASTTTTTAPTTTTTSTTASTTTTTSSTTSTTMASPSSAFLDAADGSD